MKRVLQIFRDGKSEIRYLNVDLLDGEQGNLQTLAAMVEIVNADRLQPDLRTFVLREIIRDTPGHDDAGEVARIFAYTQQRITYRQDPFGVERVADMWSTLYALRPSGPDGVYQPEGDCGIKATFFATCCALIGHKPLFVVAKRYPTDTAFSHVYNAVVLKGQLQFYDPTPEGVPPGWEVTAFEKFLVPIF